MNDRCTCGAILVADALFCHKCGRPLRELPVVGEEESPDVVDVSGAAVPAEPPARQPSFERETPAAEVSLRNSATIRASLGGAAFQFLATMLLSFGGVVLAQIAPLLAGGVACFIFQRRSQTSLGVMQGARLGWITGIMSFVVVTVLVTATFALTNNESVMSEIRAQASNTEMQRNAVKALEKMRDEPGTLLVILPYQFLMLTLMGSLGGALGAKLMRRQG